MTVHLVIFFFLVSSFQSANAQKTVKGYIVTLGNDTESVQIRIPSDLSSTKAEVELAQGIEVIENDTSRLVSPVEIKSYGFNYRGREYVRVSKSINNYRRLFLVPEFLGNKVSLYSFATSGVYSQLSGMVYKGSLVPIPLNSIKNMRIKNTYYTFEKPDGKTLFASKYTSPRDLREMLKEFFSDSSETQAEIEKKVVGSSTAADMWKAIKRIVAKYNEH